MEMVDLEEIAEIQPRESRVPRGARRVPLREQHLGVNSVRSGARRLLEISRDIAEVEAR